MMDGCAAAAIGAIMAKLLLSARDGIRVVL
jgi:hypothetical protein